MRTVNVHMLPNKEANHLILYNNRELFYTKNTGMSKHKAYVAQYIYFTSDEEIKHGDKAIELKTNRVVDCFNKDLTYLNKGGYKKIAATTDPALHYDYRIGFGDETLTPDVTKIPESYILKHIEMFNAGTPITQVQLEEEFDPTPKVFKVDEQGRNYTSGTITLKLRSDGTCIVHPIKERTFTHTEVVDIIYEAIRSWTISVEKYPDGTVRSITGIEQWMKENYPQ